MMFISSLQIDMTFVVIESWTCEQERLLNAQSSVEVEQRYDKRILL